MKHRLLQTDSTCAAQAAVGLTPISTAQAAFEPICPVAAQVAAEQTRPETAQDAKEQAQTDSKVCLRKDRSTSRGSKGCCRTDTSRGSIGCCKTATSRDSSGFSTRTGQDRTDTSRDRTRFCRTDSSRDKLMKFCSRRPSSILGFLLVSVCFVLFRFYQNTETRCFDLEAKQPKQTFCFEQCRNQFRFQFRLFRIETSFEGHPRQDTALMIIQITFCSFFHQIKSFLFECIIHIH